jgi:protein-L-isoaspartate(D-aspartate) O-methyltransferase
VTDLKEARRRYAEELRAKARLQTESLVRAFASVPREHFLGPGPWQIMNPPGGYTTTPDADPHHLYRDVLVAIDAVRFLNNGQPSGLAAWMDALDLRGGERALHVGCGVGYYTAILAATVGVGGQVTGIEIDRELAARARHNLTAWSNVSVVHGDGAALAAEPSDAIFVNAGATALQATWLDGLRAGGRLIMPLTVSLDADAARGVGVGLMLKVTRNADGYGARFFSPVGIFPCSGARDADSQGRVQDAFARGNWDAVRSLRRDAHGATGTCWLHAPVGCLSIE